MAGGVTAKFNADFSNFQKQVREGIASVAELEKAAGASEGSVQRLQRAFSGERMIRDARDTADAVARIGGASALTEREQARVNATVSEALAKYKALGIQAPADLQALAKATEANTGVMGALKQALNGVGLSLTTALGPAAIAATVVLAGKQFMDLTGKLTDLSGKTGISTTALQKLGYVTEQAGVEVEGVAAAVNKMGKNLVEGNKGAVAGIEALGLGVDSLLKLSPDQAFIQIGDAIAKVENPMERATIATKIFGKQGADLLPAFTGDLAILAKQAEDSGAVLSEDMVAGGDAAGDAIGRLMKTGMGLIGQVLGPLMPAIEGVANLLASLLGPVARGVGSVVEWLSARFLEAKVKLYDFAAGVMQTVRDIPLLGQHLGISAEGLDSMRKRADEARQQLQAFNENAAKPVTATLREAAPIVGDYSEKTEKVAKAKKDATKAAEDFAGKVKNLTGLFRELAPAIADSSQEIANIRAGFQSDGTLISRSINETATATAAARKEAEEWARVNGAVLAPSITSLGGVLKESGTKGVSMFSGLMQGVPQSILSAIQGGGNVIGAAGASIGTNLMQNFTTKFGPAITAALPFGIGTAVTALLPMLGPMFGPVAEKIAGFFKQIFGGPSQEELRGRQAVADFEKQLAGLLNQTQLNEAGNEGWKKTVIAIRDAYIAMGRTEAEALADAERLWKSSKHGAEASKAVIAEIESKMKTQGAAAEEAVLRVKRAIDSLPENVDININGSVSMPEGDPERYGSASGTKRKTGGWFANFGAGTAATLHGDEAVVPRGQVNEFVQDMGGGGGGALAAELAGLRSDFAAMPRLLARAVRDAVLVAG